MENIKHKNIRDKDFLCLPYIHGDTVKHPYMHTRKQQAKKWKWEFIGC